ncbi:MAG: methylenetetrahydrofolate reductase [NAD(P)H] [Myxococcota bacterium]|nr:methylenetetrahydrofolate reductase [NAD(P)H] [Myxococcota bacterium]
MRIIDRLKAGYPVFSFEFYPPKTEQGNENLWKAIRDLKSLQPSFISVTYGAGGSTRAKTRGLTSRIKAELGIEAMAHLTCVGSDRAEIKEIVEDLLAGGVENILCLRGDPPKGESAFEATEGGFRYGNELVEYANELNVPCIAAACYPEGHVDSPTLREDLHHLKRKVDAGADFLISQLFFDNRQYFDFVDRARAVGIDVPIVPGIMPIGNFEQIQRFTKMCGASIPEQLLEELEKRKQEPQAIHELGVAYATIQCLGLLQGGAPGIHFYTLNKSTATREILSALRMHARL